MDSHASVVSMNIFVALLCACIVIGHLLEENRWMNESITALVIVSFSLDIYRPGFSHSWTIQLSFDFLAYKLRLSDMQHGDAIAAVFSATDSVCTLQVLSQDETPLLYSLVFGESVVNDATSVVLFNAIQSFSATFCTQQITSLLLRCLWLTFHISWLNPGTSVSVSAVLLGLVMAGRAAFVLPLSFLSNLAKKSASKKNSFREQIIIWRAGLMRDVVSMALAYNQFTSAGHTQFRGNAIMIRAPYPLFYSALGV
ncbi:Sodium/hydrogen exchanger 3 [Hibiscus syriacus]|uniref:Sodium/hydrogen exchanger 3 n=1 Tax=Hibiscus syriacus TaxID=106335 RepID=A0A6A3C5F8_HIBSY|nr:Sodium/hydrogen exchanger 3 [Hibiscus syriacus]